MHVVATAGHVDHGKSTLVRALTGQDPDRLEEERRRGLSIRLGYCWTHVPGVGDVAFVDVPGHEKFITTTLAGLGPVPAAMLVVAADDPWMPQAAEHLAALDLLGVTHGLLVVTRSDLADPGPALDRARAEMAGTSLHGARAVTVSGRTGEGLDALRAELAELVRELPVPDPEAEVRLWVDRQFHVRGTGTVVTGTLAAGTIRVGDTLELGTQSVRVRGIESLDTPTSAVHGLARVALALAGKAAGDLRAGSVLVTPGAFEHADVLDVRLVGGGRVPENPVLHVGAASLGVHARPLGEAFFRLTLRHPLALRIGDRGLLRDPGSREMWGVHVLDPAPPPLRRRGAAAARAVRLTTANGTMANEIELRGFADLALLRRLGATGDAPGDAVTAGPWLISGTRAASLRAELARFMQRTSTPLRPAVPVAQVTHALGLPDERLVAALVEAPLRVHRGMVETGTASLPSSLHHALDAIRADLAGSPFVAPDAARLGTLGLTPSDLAALVRAGHLLRLADGIVLLPGADREAVHLLGELDQPFTVSQARTTLDTSRRVVLPLLAHLDRTGQTVRLPDDRRRLRR
ncbi:MAG: SelB C-terminal domain-containing protein [Nocardioidaceae bacterium]